MNPWYHPVKRIKAQIRCKHPNEKAQLTNLGMRKMFWCNDCGARWWN